MPEIIQSRTRNQIRQSIGYNLGDMILSTAGSTSAATALVDVKALNRGGDDEYNNRQVYFYAVAGTGGNAAGQWSWVSDFAAASSLATLSPAMSAAVATGDSYEMWKTYIVDEINNAINDAIIEATDDCLQIKQTATTWVERDRVEYNLPSGFLGAYRIEYVARNDEAEELSNCDAVWKSSGTANVTVAREDEQHRTGSYANKFTIGAGLAASTIIASTAITSANLSNYDTIELWLKATVSLAASALQFRLGGTADIATPTETLDLPAQTVVNTWTRYELSLTATQADTAVISVGLYQATDVGAGTVWVDDVRALKARGRVFRNMNSEQWEMIKADTVRIKFITKPPNDSLLRITGYQLPSLLTADTANSDIDPAYVISKATGELLLHHYKSAQLDIKDRVTLGNFYLTKADRMLNQIRITPQPNTRWAV